MAPKERLILCNFPTKAQLDEFLKANGIVPPKVGGYNARVSFLTRKSYKTLVSMIDHYCNA